MLGNQRVISKLIVWQWHLENHKTLSLQLPALSMYMYMYGGWYFVHAQYDTSNSNATGYDYYILNDRANLEQSSFTKSNKHS